MHSVREVELVSSPAKVKQTALCLLGISRLWHFEELSCFFVIFILSTHIQTTKWSNKGKIGKKYFQSPKGTPLDTKNIELFYLENWLVSKVQLDELIQKSIQTPIFFNPIGHCLGDL